MAAQKASPSTQAGDDDIRLATARTSRRRRGRGLSPRRTNARGNLAASPRPAGGLQDRSEAAPQRRRFAAARRGSGVFFGERSATEFDGAVATTSSGFGGDIRCARGRARCPHSGTSGDLLDGGAVSTSWIFCGAFRRLSTCGSPGRSRPPASTRTLVNIEGLYGSFQRHPDGAGRRTLGSRRDQLDGQGGSDRWPAASALTEIRRNGNDTLERPRPTTCAATRATTALPEPADDANGNMGTTRCRPARATTGPWAARTTTCSPATPAGTGLGNLGNDTCNSGADNDQVRSRRGTTASRAGR